MTYNSLLVIHTLHTYMTNDRLCSENIALQVNLSPPPPPLPHSPSPPLPTPAMLTVADEGDVTAGKGPEPMYCTPLDTEKANTYIRDAQVFTIDRMCESSCRGHIFKQCA